MNVVLALLVTLTLGTCGSLQTDVRKVEYVIVDTDMGLDDVLAISVILDKSKGDDVELAAITSVDGLAHPSHGYANILRMLKAVGKDVPVGFPDKLCGDPYCFPDKFRSISDAVPHLFDGIPEFAHNDTHNKLVSSQVLVNTITRISSIPNSVVTLVALGPLTNVAEALKLAPSISSQIDNFVIMGGAVNVPGNAPDGQAEWNIFADIPAADFVFRELRTSASLMAPLDVCSDSKWRDLFNATSELISGSVSGRLMQNIIKGAALSNYQFAYDPTSVMGHWYPKLFEMEKQSITLNPNGRTEPHNGSHQWKVLLSIPKQDLYLEAFKEMVKDSRHNQKMVFQ